MPQLPVCTLTEIVQKVYMRCCALPGAAWGDAGNGHSFPPRGLTPHRMYNKGSVEVVPPRHTRTPHRGFDGPVQTSEAMALRLKRGSPLGHPNGHPGCNRAESPLIHLPREWKCSGKRRRQHPSRNQERRHSRRSQLLPGVQGQHGAEGSEARAAGVLRHQEVALLSSGRPKRRKTRTQHYLCPLNLHHKSSTNSDTLR